MFSIAHICFLAFFALLITGLVIFVWKKFGWTKHVLYVCCGISVLSEFTRILVMTTETENGYYFRADYLPFHLCSIQIVFIAIVTFAKNEKLKNTLIAFMYPTMLAGGLMALLVPTSSVNYGFFSPLSFQLWIFHAMLVFLAIYLILAKRVKFSIKSYLISLAFLIASFVFAIYINALLGPESGANFFYVARPPLDNLPLMNLNNGWYVYIVNLIWIATALITLCYTPAFVKAIKSKIKRVNNDKTISNQA